MLSGSIGWGPAQTSKKRAASRTERDRQPWTAVFGREKADGPRGMRPNVPFIPKSPV